MKKTDVLLSIKGIHTTEYDTDTLEFITSGTLVSEGDDCSVSYQETEMTGMEGLVTTLYIHGSDKVVIRRSGSYDSQLILEKGRKNLSHYNTEAGPMLMSVSARNIIASLKDGLGELFVDYTLEINHQVVSQNQLYITIREADGSHDQPHPAS